MSKKRLASVGTFVSKEAKVIIACVITGLTILAIVERAAVLEFLRNLTPPGVALMGGITVLGVLVAYLVKKLPRGTAAVPPNASATPPTLGTPAIPAVWTWPSSQTWLNAVGFGVLGVFLIAFGAGTTSTSDVAGQPVAVQTAKPATSNPIDAAGKSATTELDKATNKTAAAAPAATPETSVVRFKMPSDPILLAAIGGDDQPEEVALAFASWADKALNPPGTKDADHKSITPEEFDAVKLAYVASGLKPANGVVDTKVIDLRKQWLVIYKDRDALKASIIEKLCKK